MAKSDKFNNIRQLIAEKTQLLLVAQDKLNKYNETILVKEVELKGKLDKVRQELDEIRYAGISPNNEKMLLLHHCTNTMNDDLIHFINSFFETIHKSPFSCSIYNAEKTWTYTEPNSYSITDHWNFYSKGEYHKLTSTNPLDEIAKLNESEDVEKHPNLYWYLAQYVIGEKPFDEHMAELSAESKGAWVIKKIWRKDTDKNVKIYQLETEIENLERDLTNLKDYELMRTYSIINSELELYNWLLNNGYSSVEDYTKVKKKELSEKIDKINQSLKEKIEMGLVTGTVTKKEWGGTKGRFKLIGEDTYSGIVVSRTSSTITIKTSNNELITGKDYTLDLFNLTQDEKYSFHNLDICIDDLYSFTKESKYQICKKTNLKL